jgi:ribosomal protein S12 methylthiotransferase accessory factor
MLGTSSPWEFRSAPKHRELAARVVSIGETARRLESLIARVPITRISDLTPLDPLGLPVYVSVTPLARDLTTHAGKGTDRPAARVSAIMEAIERVSAEGAETAVRASFAKLSAGTVPPLDPHLFDLPPDTSYRPTRACAWVLAHDFQQDRAAMLARDLAINPPEEGILRSVDTNGLASGNTHLEAVVHGICEVLERDALSQLEFRLRYADPASASLWTCSRACPTLPPAAARWLEQLLRLDLQVAIQWIPTDVGVATFRTVIVDPAYPSAGGTRAAFFVGLGTHPDASTALMRSLTEAVQSRVGSIQGARDSFNTLGGTQRSVFSRLDSIVGAPSIPFSAIPSFTSQDLLEDFRYLLGCLARAGISGVFAVDLTRRDLGIPVVRVRISGLSSFVVNRRRVGWRCLKHLL